VFSDTVLSGGDSLVVHAWPDSQRVVLNYFNRTLLELLPLREFERDSLHLLDGQYQWYWAPAWRSGSEILPDSTLTPLKYRVDGDSLRLR
jgi:hypothetical protein